MSGGPSRGRWLAFAVVAAACLALALGLGGYWSVRAQTSGAFCGQGCHVDKADTHYASVGHENAACQACHSISIGAGLRLGASRALGLKGSAKHGAVSSATCTSCHDPRNADWLRVSHTEGHRTHPNGLRDLDCLSCHKQSSHKRVEAATGCLDCHADTRLHDKTKHDESGHPQCLGCHNFSVARPDRPSHAALTAEQCTRCHSEGAVKAEGVVPASAIRASDLHGGVDCKQCHEPHAKAKGSDKARPCGSCHQIQLVSSSPNLPKEHLECTSCHKQHQPLARAGEKCITCHEQARAKSKTETSTALRHDECASCHLPHSWAAAPNECVTCHTEQASLVEHKSPIKHQRCNNCHEVHGAPPSAATCAGCHQGNARKQLKAPAKHQNCVSCHNPHAPSVQVPTTCAECHKAALHQLVSLGPGAHMKASCTACHVTHGNPRADVKTCSTCHREKATAVVKAGPQPHTRCESCHQPHRFTVDPNAPPCAKCHQEIATSSRSHGGKCSGCHTPHGSPSVPREKCLGCHETIHYKAPAGNAEHSRCGSCHQPHKAATVAASKCSGCHADKKAVAERWPKNSAHHDACEKCHKPHDIRAAVACGGCHEKQQTSATGGKHQCKQCHAPHQAPAANTKGWWGRCANCHAKQVAASKPHNQCENCHKPHSFKPPDCKSCHADAANKAAHRAKEHAVCTKCHDAHGATLPGRAECISCHADKSNHQPQAQRCFGCHPFK